MLDLPGRVLYSCRAGDLRSVSSRKDLKQRGISLYRLRGRHILQRHRLAFVY